MGRQPVSMPVDIKGLTHIPVFGVTAGQTMAMWPLWPSAQGAPTLDERKGRTRVSVGPGGWGEPHGRSSLGAGITYAWGGER